MQRRHLQLRFSVGTVRWARAAGWLDVHGGARSCSSTGRSAASAAGGVEATADTPAAANDEAADVVTPWEVRARGPKGIDYARVTETFKAQTVDADVVRGMEAAMAAVRSRIESSCGSGTPDEAPPAAAAAAPSKPHHLIRRGIVFAHRDATAWMDAVAAGQRAYLYTGRGPSANAMHIGHVVPFLLTVSLQRAFQVPLVIQLTDDEKFLFRNIPLAKMDQMTSNNIKDIIAFGVDRDKTFIFRNTRYMGAMYPTVLEIQRLFTANAVKNTFGFSEEDNIGKIAFAATQAAPCFASAFPRVLPCKTRNAHCLVPCAVDQDPFFVLTRNAAPRMKRPKPSLLLTKFMPAMKGAMHKMSSSAEQNGTVLLTDSAAVVQQKLKRAFSGGRGTMEDLVKMGADLDADVAYQLMVFLCEDDDRVETLGREYQAGTVSSGAVKSEAASVVNALLAEFQARRAAVTDADVEHFASERPLW